MRLWIIQDEDYSELKKVPGCEDFCNLPATKKDAEQIRELASKLGIEEANINHFNKSSKQTLQEFYTRLKDHYTTLMREKDIERVFLLVYCSGHGVTSNGK